MDIRKPSQTQTEQTSSTQPKDETNFKVGTVTHASGRLLLPPAVQQSLTVIGQKYGLPMDLSEIALDGTLAEKVKATRKIVDLAKGDGLLLKEMLKLVKSLLSSELKLVDFYKKVNKEALKFQTTIDKQTADIFLAANGYQQNSKKLEHRTNLRVQLKEKRTQAYLNYYSDSVFGEESKIIDCEFEVLASNQKVLSDSKQERIKLESERKQKLNEYVQSAYR